MVLSKSTLRETDDFLSSLVKKAKSDKPTDLQMVYYILAKEFGITLDKVQHLPIRYLTSLISTYNYVNKEEEKAHKKAMKKK